MAKRNSNRKNSASSGPKHWTPKKPKVIGVDFGVRPTVMALGDVEFPDLLNKSFVGLAYGEVEEQTEGGVIVLRPGLAMGFEDAGIAKNCFERFKAWIDGSQDEAALGMSFIDYDEGGYGLCIYQEPMALLERCVPEAQRPFVDPLTVCVGHVKRFPDRSEGYEWFKSKAAGTTIVVEPITRTESFSDLRFHKSTVRFYTETSVPEGSTEASLLRGKDMKDGERSERRERPLPSPEQLFDHRLRCLSRFFPVTIEKASLSREFESVRSTLAGCGYRDWQIQQAVCVIALRHRNPGLFTPPQPSDETRSAGVQSSILDYLLSNPEDALTTRVPSAELTFEALNEQIAANSEALLTYFIRGTVAPSRQGFQEELERHVLLDRTPSQ